MSAPPARVPASRQRRRGGRGTAMCGDAKLRVRSEKQNISRTDAWLLSSSRTFTDGWSYRHRRPEDGRKARCGSSEAASSVGLKSSRSFQSGWWAWQCILRPGCSAGLGPPGAPLFRLLRLFRLVCIAVAGRERHRVPLGAAYDPKCTRWRFWGSGPDLKCTRSRRTAGAAGSVTPRVGRAGRMVREGVRAGPARRDVKTAGRQDGGTSRRRDSRRDVRRRDVKTAGRQGRRDVKAAGRRRRDVKGKWTSRASGRQGQVDVRAGGGGIRDGMGNLPEAGERAAGR